MAPRDESSLVAKFGCWVTSGSNRKTRINIVENSSQKIHNVRVRSTAVILDAIRLSGMITALGLALIIVNEHNVSNWLKDTKTDNFVVYLKFL